MAMKTAWTPGQVGELVAAYRGGEATTSIARRLGVSLTPVLRVLREQGVAIRSNAASHRRLALDEHYFDAIDTEAKAYWLGFLAADGSITERNCVALVLAEADGDHVGRFRDAIGAGHKLMTVTNAGYRSVRLAVRSDVMVAALARHGVVPNKSLTAAPAQITPELMRHYWRGVFDGDGSLYESASAATRGMWCLGLVGSRSMVEGFAAFARPVCGSRASVRPSNSRAWRFETGGNPTVARVVGALYADAAVALERKRLCAERVLAAHAQKPLHLSANRDALSAMRSSIPKRD